MRKEERQMRKKNGSVLHLAKKITEDLNKRETGLSKPQLIGLADIAGSVLAAKSVNTSEIASLLPRTCKNVEDRYRYINRWLSNEKINPDQVMAGYYKQLFKTALSQKTAVVFMIDQSTIGRGFECLMLSARLGNRAVPLAWQVRKTQGNIGFEVQKDLLKSIVTSLPSNLNIVLMGDRFYGTGKMIELCESFGWHYRFRLKGNLHLYDHTGALITPQKAHQLGLKELEKVRLGENGPTIQVGIIQEAGHPEPWFIAMDQKPTQGHTLDYGKRWGIEALFSDLKSRGFGITQTQLQHPERIERLILVLTIAYYWAVSTGMEPQNDRLKSKKKSSDL